jgi:hypothetical protein
MGAGAKDIMEGRRVETLVAGIKTHVEVLLGFEMQLAPGSLPTGFIAGENETAFACTSKYHCFLQRCLLF